MTVNERCPITELQQAGCSHCRGLDEPVRETRRSFTSAYPGECSACGEEFNAGDRIRSDGGNGYIAEHCEDNHA